MMKNYLAKLHKSTIIKENNPKWPFIFVAYQGSVS